MVRATLEFNLPEEESEHRACLDGGKWNHVLWEIDQILRSTVKHGENQVECEYAEKIRHHIVEQMDGKGLSWNE